jgi:hypothetical protein
MVIKYDVEEEFATQRTVKIIPGFTTCYNSFQKLQTLQTKSRKAADDTYLN